MTIPDVLLEDVRPPAAKALDLLPIIDNMGHCSGSSDSEAVRADVTGGPSICQSCQLQVGLDFLRTRVMGLPSVQRKRGRAASDAFPKRWGT